MNRKEFRPDQRRQLEELATLPEEEIDTLDIPEAADEN